MTADDADPLRDLEAGLLDAIEMADELPAPTTHAAYTQQAYLWMRLNSALRAVRTLLEFQTPARRDPSTALVGAASDAIATPGGPAYIRTPGLPADVIAIDWAGLR